MKNDCDSCIVSSYCVGIQPLCAYLRVGEILVQEDKCPYFKEKDTICGGRVKKDTTY